MGNLGVWGNLGPYNLGSTNTPNRHVHMRGCKLSHPVELKALNMLNKGAFTAYAIAAKPSMISAWQA